MTYFDATTQTRHWVGQVLNFHPTPWRAVQHAAWTAIKDTSDYASTSMMTTAARWAILSPAQSKGEDRVALLVVRGLGDVGSAVAHRLFSDGYNVVLHDEPQPTVTRRKMSFADAAFDGVAMLEGVEARRAPDLTAIPDLLARRLVTVYLGPFEPLVAALKPDVLVDARMRKRAVPENQRGLATVTVGLGPNFKAGQTCDIAVETSWEALGAVIREGAPLPLAGEPRELGGHARERYVYAPCTGVFRTSLQIGDTVTAGQPVARIDATVLAAPLGGVLRGLTHDGVPVTERTKVIEVDPRGRAAEVAGISERPRRIADGVSAAIRAIHSGRRGEDAAPVDFLRKNPKR